MSRPPQLAGSGRVGRVHPYQWTIYPTESPTLGPIYVEVWFRGSDGLHALTPRTRPRCAARSARWLAERLAERAVAEERRRRRRARR